MKPREQICSLGPKLTQGILQDPLKTLQAKHPLGKEVKHAQV